MKKNTLKLDSVISNQVEKLTDVISANSIVGNKIVTDDKVTIIPVTKIIVGYVNGGGEYGEVKLFNKEKPFLGGGGAIVNVSPNGFLVVKNGVTNFIKIADDFIEGIFDKTTAFVEKVVNEKK
ncbi:MAG: hypothetical protein IKA85_06625 [Clostridia bacterium]|nr:hypothetical protein [Clostridia bacterium]